MEGIDVSVFGTIINAVAIVLGGFLGLLFGQALSEKMKTTLLQGIGLAVLLIGAGMAIKTENILVVITSLVIGGALGAWLDIEYQLSRFGNWLEVKLAKDGQKGKFTNAFVATSLIYCVGAMAIMGALEAGLNHNYDILFAKAMLDGISAIVFASSMGIGVLASAIPVFIYQGIITLSASLLQGVLSPEVVNEMSATGGLLIVGIGLSILEIKTIKVGNLLPSIFVAIPVTLLFIKANFGG